MKNLNKRIVTMLTLILTLSMCALMTGTSTANAALEIDTYCFLSVTPNPVGINQQVTVIGWIN
jgi:hypothetical protein